MNRSAALLAAVLLTLAPPLAAGDDALSLVPPDAAAVGLIRVADLRTSPLFDRVFAGTDRLSGDAEAARFLEEVRLDPKQDVDLVVVAGSPKGAGPAGGIAAFEGRFEAAKLAAATASRGGVRKSAAGTDYYLLPEHGTGMNHDPGAVAFLSNRLIVAGSESAVVGALTRRAAGGGGFAAGAGLGSSLSRVDTKASAWAVVDVARTPAGPAGKRVRAEGTVEGRRLHAEGSFDEPALAVVSAMKSVSLLAFSATTEGDALKLSVTGVAADTETRQNLGDAVRGVLAVWRMAAQEKDPDLVPVLRRFQVSEGKDSVTLSGTLPGQTVRELAARKGHVAK